MMENNIDKNIREKLKNREIQPSTSAWERLSGRLDTHQNKQKKKRFLYLGYAASILVLISLSLLFLNNNEKNTDVINDNTIVKQEVTIPEVKNNFKKEIVEDAIVNKSEKEQEILKDREKSIKISEPKSIKKSVITQQKQVKPKKEFVEKIDTKTVIEKEEPSIATIEKIKEPKSIDEKKKNTRSITVDSDALLYAVTHTKEEIKAYYKKYKIDRDEVLLAIKKELKKSRLKIDPNSILAEVERDVNEESFQNNFYQFVKKRVSDVATAIANRNN